MEAGSTVESRGAAKITAEASNEDDVWRAPDSPDSFPELLGTVDNPLGQVTRVSARVDVGGTVTGQSVMIDASATNMYNSLNDTSKLSDISQDVININKFLKHYNWIKKLHDSLGVDVMYSYLDTKAEVDIQSTAVVTAKGADSFDNEGNFLSPALSITAGSQARNLMTAQTKTEKGQEYQKKDAKRVGEDNTDNEARKAYQAKKTEHYGSLSVVYGGNDTAAAVNINGTVKAEQGSANIKANSVNAYNVKSVVLISQDDNSGGAGTNLLKSMKLMGQGSKVDDEMVVFSSQELCTQVVKQLKLNRSYIEDKGWFKAERDHYNSSPVEIVAPEEFFDTLTTSLKFKIDVDKDGLVDIESKFRKKKMVDIKDATLPVTVKTPFGVFAFQASEGFKPGKPHHITASLYGNQFRGEQLNRRINIKLATKFGWEFKESWYLTAQPIRFRSQLRGWVQSRYILVALSFVHRHLGRYRLEEECQRR